MSLFLTDSSGVTASGVVWSMGPAWNPAEGVALAGRRQFGTLDGLKRGRREKPSDDTGRPDEENELVCAAFLSCHWI